MSDFLSARHDRAGDPRAIRRYQLAEHGIWTVAALLAGLLHAVALAAAVSHFVLTHWVEDVRPLILPDLDHGWLLLLIPVVVVESMLNLLEWVVHHRSWRSGFLLPLLWIPLGRSLRTVIVDLMTTLICLPKLAVYLVGITVVIPLQELVAWLIPARGAPAGWPLLHTLATLLSYAAPLLLAASWIGLLPVDPLRLLPVALLGIAVAALDIDRFDDLAERPEAWSVHLYNGLHYAKVDPRGGVFTVLFNRPLWMWSMHHR